MRHGVVVGAIGGLGVGFRFSSGGESLRFVQSGDAVSVCSSVMIRRVGGELIGFLVSEAWTWRAGLDLASSRLARCCLKLNW